MSALSFARTMNTREQGILNATTSPTTWEQRYLLFCAICNLISAQVGKMYELFFRLVFCLTPVTVLRLMIVTTAFLVIPSVHQLLALLMT